MSTSPIPQVRDDDPEDVSWALSTAATSFARGDRIEAVKWLRRAAEAASEAERDGRALEIAKAAAELSPSSAPKAAVPAAPASMPPPISARPPMPPSSARPPPLSKPPPISAKPPPLSVKPPPPTSKPPPKPPQEKAGPKTVPPPAPAKRPSVRPGKPEEATKRAPMKSRPRPIVDEPTATHVMSELSKADVEPTNVADGWPAEAPSPEAAPRDASGVYGQERTRIGAPAYRPEKRQEKRPVVVRSSQAVHVVVWRDPDGSLRIAPRGTVVSAVTIDALLVAPGPDVDLIAWLSS